MSDFNQSKYINDYIKETYDTIKIQVPKGKRDTIKKQAKDKGYKSVNAYINNLIAKDMEQAGEKQNIHVQNNQGFVISGDNNKGFIVGDVHGDLNL